MFWPVEGMPLILRIISYMTPSTYTGISMRNIIEKGYTITHHTVLIAFGILIIWVVGTILLGLMALKNKKYSRNT